MTLYERGERGKVRPPGGRVGWFSAVAAALILFLSGAVLFVLGAVVHSTLSYTKPTATVSPRSDLLTWKPPPCGDTTHACIDLQLGDTGSNQYLELQSDNDYRIHLPADRPLRGGIQLRNAGRNVIIIGGQIDLTVPCSDDTSDCHGIMISQQSGGGHVFIEGVWIRNPAVIPRSCPARGMPCSTGDGIVLDDDPRRPTDVTLQNVRIDGISGCSGGSDHADVFQPYAAPDAVIHVDRLTGTTNCQGMHVDPDLAYRYYGKYPKDIVMKNVNIGVHANPYSGDVNRYVAWLTYQQHCNSGPISLDNFYVREPDGTLEHAAWPDTAQPGACRSLWNPAAKQLSFPRSPQIRGVIHFGVPPGGDFVPAGKAGLRYVSSGYR
jgi:hypothetical protein